MRLMAVAVAVGVAVAGTATSATAAGSGDSRGNTLRVQLSGYEEDPQAISTTGAGQFWAQVDRHGQTITFRLSYSGLVGNVTQAHIHFGGRAQSGGIVVFLCTNQGNGPAGTQACPAAPATVTGVITPATVIGPAGQGIAAGEFAEFVDAIRAGTTYANVHSSVYPAGEIRGQLGHH
jgi:hypothetical protein